MENKIKPQLRLQEKKDIKEILRQNIVVIIFTVLTVIGVILSDLPFHFMVRELVSRIGRNSFLVLSLIIPILAGVGLNFGIVVGAMAGQLGLIMVTYWGITGIPGILLTVLIATPVAVVLGWQTGVLFNKTKGQEMIAGLIVGYFANGLYQFVFLFLVGTLIPMKPGTPMVKPDGIGLRNTISLGSKHGEGMKYALDYVLQVNVWQLLIAAALALIAFKIIRNRKRGFKTPVASLIPNMILVVVSLVILLVPTFRMLANIKAPVVTWLLIVGLCLFNILIMKTKLGQDFKAIGRSQHIASVAGINVDQTRIIAVILSTVFASWGQIIFLQNIGTMNTYGSHMQVGMFSIAAILIGGASVTKANIWQALVGVILFHSVFIVSPTAGKVLFGDAQIGEFFRSFVVYGVIGVSLGLHAWKAATAKKKEETEE